MSQRKAGYMDAIFFLSFTNFFLASRGEPYMDPGGWTGVVERLWRSVKYEDVYLRAYETPRELRAGLGRYFEFYNCRRRHQALDRRTPDAVYYEQAGHALAA